MTKIMSIVILLSMFIFTGCNSKIFMPYEEEPLCKAGKETGYCGSVSDVYEVKIEENSRR